VWGRGLVEEDFGPVQLLHEGEQGALLTVPAAHSHHCVFINVVDPDHFAADPGPTFHCDVDLCPTRFSVYVINYHVCSLSICTTFQ
jgi:hypothetical protein